MAGTGEGEGGASFKARGRDGGHVGFGGTKIPNWPVGRGMILASKLAVCVLHPILASKLAVCVLHPILASKLAVCVLHPAFSALFGPY